MRFEFATAKRIIFGTGTVGEIPAEAGKLGTRVLVVSGRSAERVQPLIDQLADQVTVCATVPVASEPTVRTVADGAVTARKEKCDLVIACGGGSVIDTGKAIAAMITNRGNLSDYLEVIGRGTVLTEPPAPFIAVPTTAGTGAEVTKNAVIASPEHRVKVSLRNPSMLPDLAVVDPEQTLSLPPDISASTGLDALTQCIESYVSCRSNPLTRALCGEGITRAARSLRTVCSDGGSLSGREDMSLASLFSGLALANSGLGAVHGIAGPAGGMTGAPHGILCARLLPGVMKTNIRTLSSKHPESPFLVRYREVAGMLTGDPAAGPENGTEWIEKLCEDLPLSSGDKPMIEKNLFPGLAAAAQRASSMKGNPVQLSKGELIHILEEAF